MEKGLEVTNGALVAAPPGAGSALSRSLLTACPSCGSEGEKGHGHPCCPHLAAPGGKSPLGKRRKGRNHIAKDLWSPRGGHHSKGFSHKSPVTLYRCHQLPPNQPRHRLQTLLSSILSFVSVVSTNLFYSAAKNATETRRKQDLGSATRIPGSSMKNLREFQQPWL